MSKEDLNERLSGTDTDLISANSFGMDTMLIFLINLQNSNVDYKKIFWVKD